MTTKSVQINEKQRINFFPDFNEDVALLRVEKWNTIGKCNQWWCFALLFKNITLIRKQNAVEFDYKQFTVAFYQNREDLLQMLLELTELIKNLFSEITFGTRSAGKQPRNLYFSWENWKLTL